MKCTIEATGTINIHNTLHNTAHHIKKRLDAHYDKSHEIEGTDLKKMSLFTFLAFSVEAHANYVGNEMHFPDWGDRWIWKDKIKSILKDKDHGLDWNMPPLSIVSRLFEFRDLLAHGRPVSEELSLTVEVEVADPEEHRKLVEIVAPWEELLNEIDYIEAYDAVDELWKKMREIHELNLFDTLCGGESKVSYSN